LEITNNAVVIWCAAEWIDWGDAMIIRKAVGDPSHICNTNAKL
jgi:hypothetical protein